MKVISFEDLPPDGNSFCALRRIQEERTRVKQQLSEK